MLKAVIPYFMRFYKTLQNNIKRLYYNIMLKFRLQKRKQAYHSLMVRLSSGKPTHMRTVPFTL